MRPAAHRRSTSRLDEVQVVQREDMPRLAQVWEASVRATHDFLTETDIQRFKLVVRDDLFGALPLYCVRDPDGVLVAFSGVSEGRLEALFVDPDWRSSGIGRRLVHHAVDELGATTVDVNEQNDQAVGFCRRMGFEVDGRSELDENGLPYPLLHMRLAATRRDADQPQRRRGAA
jgi:putative acetyltransferase